MPATPPGRVRLIVVGLAVVAVLSVVAIRLSPLNQNGTTRNPRPRRAVSAPAPSTPTNSELVGKWKCEGEVITEDDGSQRHIPYTGIDEDLELLENGQFVDGKEGVTGEFTILDSNHVQFRILSAGRGPKGRAYVNEFKLAGDKLTLSITKNPKGVTRRDILYLRR